MKLIEKLEQEYQEWCDREDNSVFGDVSQIDARGRTRGLKDAIEIVKQHSEWVSVKECLPPEEVKLLFEHEDYGVVIGYYRDRGGFVTHDTTCNHRDSIDEFLKWCYIPISEVVDI